MHLRDAWKFGALGLVLGCSAGDGASDTTQAQPTTGSATDTGTGGPTGDTPTGAGPQGDDDGDTANTGDDGTGATQGDDTGVTTDVTTDVTTGDDTGEPGELGGPFLRGINLGYRNPAWGDPDMAWLAAQGGRNRGRLSLAGAPPRQ